VEGSVRTVGADLSRDEPGPTDHHEHASEAAPLLSGNELADRDRGAHKPADLPHSGSRAVVDATPLGFGRRPARLPEVAQLAIDATSGRRSTTSHQGGTPWDE
jgi:predicted metal-dependent phosphotriesterase family hydrolase